MTRVLPIDVPAVKRFENAAEWLHALGDVPLHRIIFDPFPGTATEADLLYLVERDKLCELIDGTLVEKPVGFWESLIATNLITLLNAFVQPRNLGVVTGPDSTMRMASRQRIRLPDVSFISTARMPKTREPIPTLAPDLAIEVLSTSNTAREINQKLSEYFDSGTLLAWVVDPPTRTVAVYRTAGAVAFVLEESDQLDGEQVLPGFVAPVMELFRNVPRD